MEGIKPVKKYFFAEESAAKPGKYMICLDFNLLPIKTTEGSYNILPARLLGISYANYCRLCRDSFQGEIQGKGSMYPVCYFKRDDNLNALLRLLNKRMELILKLKENKLPNEYEDDYRAEYEREILSN